MNFESLPKETKQKLLYIYRLAFIVDGSKNRNKHPGVIASYVVHSLAKMVACDPIKEAQDYCKNNATVMTAA